MINIVFLGECMVEENTAKQFRYGGDSLNTALYLTRIVNPEQINVYYATAIGQDEISKKLKCSWQSEGIKTDFVLDIADKKIGRYSVTVNGKGERSFCYNRNDSAAVHYMKRSCQAFAEKLNEHSIDYVYFTGISLAILPSNDIETLFTLLTAFKKQGGKVLFDNNYRAVLWQERDPLLFYRQAMHLADSAFLTDEDEYALYGGSKVSDIVDRYAKSSTNNEKELVIKQGKKPCVIKRSFVECSKTIHPLQDKKDVLTSVDAQKIAAQLIVDTCAAGDAFSAGYLAKRLTDENIESSAKFGHLLAGRVIQYSGAIIEKQAMVDLMPVHSTL